ncbi:DUF4347 domain-containing protein, partial [Thiocystis violacea]|uniref:DUF4347 domain-containing protein n=1 Tax=Thiocystis violacea TaxID=13725 RepID=UPI001A934FD8
SCRPVLDELIPTVDLPGQWVANDHDALLADGVGGGEFVGIPQAWTPICFPRTTPIPWNNCSIPKFGPEATPPFRALIDSTAVNASFQPCSFVEILLMTAAATLFDRASASLRALRTELVFVDASLPDLDSLLAGREGIDALHILSHGDSGQVRLGNLSLDGDALDAHAETLGEIGAALSEEGDILLYGCNVAAGATGVAFVERLARATGADVAASEDVAGSAGRRLGSGVRAIARTLQINIFQRINAFTKKRKALSDHKCTRSLSQTNRRVQKIGDI